MQHGMDNSVVSKNRVDVRPIPTEGSGFGQKDGTFHFRTTILPPDELLEAGGFLQGASLWMWIHSEGTYISSWRKQRFSWCLVESDFWWTGSGQEAHCVPRELHEEVRVWWLLSRAKKKTFTFEKRETSTVRPCSCGAAGIFHGLDVMCRGKFARDVDVAEIQGTHPPRWIGFSSTQGLANRCEMLGLLEA